MRITKFFAPAAMLFALFLSSCTSSDVSDTTTPDCAITVVTVGTLSRDYTTTLESGADTTYTITVPGSSYPMHIDQINRIIYNTDSLPLGTRVNKVYFSAFTADGTIAYRTASGKDTLFSIKKDTLDFTNSRIFSVYAADGSGNRAYTISINVHKVDPEAYTWKSVETANSDIAAMTDMRSLVNNKVLYVWGKENGSNILMTRATSDEGSWSRSEVSGSDIDAYTVTLFKNKFYAISTAGLAVSTDGKTWSSAGANITPTRLLGAADTELYAATASAAYRSSDGVTWTTDSLDDEFSLLPQKEIMSVNLSMLMNSKIQNVITVGYNGTSARIWKKEVDLTGKETNSWSYYPETEENFKRLPYLDGLSLIRYESSIFAAGISNDTAKVYVSQDGARTWIASTAKHILPSTIGKPASLSEAVDENNMIWLLCSGTGQVWHGYLNRLLSTANK